MRNLLTLLIAVIVSPGMAQDAAALFEKAPPHIEEALRERVDFFFQAHVDGKFRLADAVVHEDSKDAFFASAKRQYKSYDIIRINYSEDFTRADVVVSVETDFTFPAIGKQVVNIAVASKWRYDQDQWWWYLPPAAEGGRESPFGKLTPSDVEGAANPAERLQKMPKPEDIQNLIKVEKRMAVVDCAAGKTDTIVIQNDMNGPISVRLSPPDPDGYIAEPGSGDVPPNGNLSIVFRCDPDSSSTLNAYQGALRISPTNQVIPIVVRVDREAAKDSAEAK